jgi:hypothetical protein
MRSVPRKAKASAMKTIVTTTLILCLSGGASFAQGPSLTISYADQEKTTLERICSGAATGQDTAQDRARAPDMAKRDADFSGILAKTSATTRKGR